MFDPNLSPEQLAWIAFSDDLVGPNGYGQHLNVKWAANMVPEPASIEWISVWTDPTANTNIARATRRRPIDAQAEDVAAGIATVGRFTQLPQRA